jgi:hypothetical protein
LRGELVREVSSELVRRYRHGLCDIAEGIFGNDPVLLPAEEDADAWLINRRIPDKVVSG